MDLYDDNSLAKILGVHVNVTLINNEIISGQIYSYIKDKKILIRK